MNLRHLLSKQTIKNISRINGRSQLHYPYIISIPISSLFHSINTLKLHQNSECRVPISSFNKYFHSTSESKLCYLGGDKKLDLDDSVEDGTMNEFLSRFVWTMRGKLSEAYPDCDKQTIDSMLLVIVGKVTAEVEKGGIDQMLDVAQSGPSQDFSEDLWTTVWEVSNMVLDDMRKATKKEKMKHFLQSEEVKQMYRFAGEIGIRGDMLRELRFKWAGEKMEESEFYESLEQIRKEEQAQEKAETESTEYGTMGEEAVVAEEKPKFLSLPKRRGKLRYKIYGLDLSDPKWAEVADRFQETGEIIWPQEPKPIFGKCKLVTEKILSLNEANDPSPLLAEWEDLLQPTRTDWINLLDRLKEQNSHLYLKVAELVLSQKSFQANIHDYSRLIDAHAKDNHLEDAERILKKMNDTGFPPDILTATSLVHIYSKVGNFDRAKEAFESLRSHGFQPDLKVYRSMFMAYVNAGQPNMAESLMREMETRNIRPTEELYMALLRSFSQRGDAGAVGRVATAMQFSGFEPNSESCALLVEAHGKVGDPVQARNNFDYMIKIGHRPDDRCTASMIEAYEKKNLLEKALNLLLDLEKDGFQPGIATYTVLVDWLGKLQLVDEAEQLLGRISELGEAPPLKLHVSLCYMYAKTGVEKKALQALGVLEAKKEQLSSGEYERVINGLIVGGFVQHAHRVRGLMEAQGFSASETLELDLMRAQASGHAIRRMR